MLQSHSALIVALALFAAAKSPANTLDIKTPTGEVTATFVQISPAQLSSQIAAACLDRGLRIDERSDQRVVCTDAETGMLLTSTRTREIARFNIIDVAGNIRVHGEAIRLVNQPMRPITRAEGIFDRDMLDILDELGGQFPQGTTFKGNDLGVYGRTVYGKAGGFLVNKVVPGSAAEEAGLRAGDLVRRINRKPITYAMDMRLRTEKLKPGATIAIEIDRGGIVMRVVAAAIPRRPVF